MLINFQLEFREKNSLLMNLPLMVDHFYSLRKGEKKRSSLFVEEGLPSSFVDNGAS